METKKRISCVVLSCAENYRYKYLTIYLGKKRRFLPVQKSKVLSTAVFCGYFGRSLIGLNLTFDLPDEFGIPGRKKDCLFLDLKGPKKGLGTWGAHAKVVIRPDQVQEGGVFKLRCKGKLVALV